MRKNSFYALLVFSMITIIGYRILSNIIVSNIDSRELKLVDEVGDISQLGSVRVEMIANTSTRYALKHIDLNSNNKDKNINSNYDMSRAGALINKADKNFFRGKDIWDINNKGEKNYVENQDFIIILNREFKGSADDYILYLKDKNTSKTYSIKLEALAKTNNSVGINGLEIVNNEAIIVMTNTNHENNTEKSQLIVYEINLVSKEQNHGVVDLSETKNISQQVCSYLLENNKLILAMYPKGIRGYNLSEEEVKKYAEEKLWAYDLKTKEITKRAVDATVSFEGTKLISNGEYIYLIDGEFGKLSKLNKENLEFIQSIDVKFMDEKYIRRNNNAINLQHVAVENNKLYNSYEAYEVNGPQKIVSVIDLNNGELLYKGKVGSGDFNNYIFGYVESIRFEE